MRLADARVLLRTRRNASGAYYLAGYAVECALKACIAKKTKAGDWPATPEEVRKLYSHKLEDLIKLAELDTYLEAEKRANSTFAGYWGTVKDWSEKSRYEMHSQSEAQTLYDAITDASNGVLPWIQRYW